MKNVSEQYGGVIVRALIVSLLLAPVSFSSIIASAETESDISSLAAGTITGEILEIEENTLVIKKPNGEEVRVRMPGRTEEAAKDFEVGENVEVYVTPEGTTTSVHELTDGFIR
ncbi:MAG: hypothetical protein NPIRA01_01870 [Nitrospirales bacterium]|nr:MAG: hypothetical protein NPIRA01_01870 [Nitrospirales bacterium]